MRRKYWWVVMLAVFSLNSGAEEATVALGVWGAVYDEEQFQEVVRAAAKVVVEAGSSASVPQASSVAKAEDE